MATESVLAPLDVSIEQSRQRAGVTALSDYLALTKPDVNFLIVVTTFAGFYLGTASPLQFLPLLNTLLGTLLVASGTGTLNQYIERHFDARMRRTARRPLAAGRLKPSAVLWFGIALSAIGGIYLAVVVNGLASLFAIFTLLSYLFVYTPLKRKAPLCTVVGAIPGAMPPLIGYAAATGGLSSKAWTLYALLFFWQFPHFMAIAWMYREDYDQAGYQVLPHNERSRVRVVNLQTLLPLFALVTLSVFAVLGRESSAIYRVGALILSLGFLYEGIHFVVRKSNPSARRLLTASILYLPLLFVLIILS